MEKLNCEKWKNYYDDDLKKIIDLIKNYIIENDLEEIISITDNEKEMEKFITFLYNNSSKYKCKYL